MTRHDKRPEDANALRKKAEARLLGGSVDSSAEAPEAPETPSVADALALVHELQVHQIELKLQNEELQRSRAEAEAARERYVDLYDFAPVGYFTLSRDAVIREANLTGARLLGVQRSLLLSRSLTAFLAEGDRRVFEVALSAAIEHRRQETCEVELAPPTAGTPVTPYLQLTISASELGEVRVVAFDATERKRSLDQVLTSQKLEAVGQLAGGVAHDFNNALTIILSHAEMALEEAPPGAPLYRHLSELKMAAEHTAAVTRQLLAFSSKQVSQPKIVDLNLLVRKTVNMLRRLVGEEVRIELSLANESVTVELDPVQLDQVLMNLAVNARDAMPRGGLLSLSTTHADVKADLASSDGATTRPVVRLTVTDTGCGMDARTQARVFEPFFTTKELGRGTGLGLSTVFGIVKQWGGGLALESAVDRGTTFQIDIPRVADRHTSSIPPPGTKKVAEGGTETILVVEDEAQLLAIAVRALSSVGYRVLGASDGAEALRVCAAHQGPIHLALTDVIMAGMTGVEFAERIGRVRPDTKVLYMSGYSADVLARRGLAGVEVHLLNKPFTLAHLRKSVREMLDTSTLSPQLESP